MENIPEKAEQCRLSSLQPLLPHHQAKWAPGENDYQLLLTVLDRHHLEVNDLDDFDRGSDREDETVSENSSESETDSCTNSVDGDEDEDEDDSGNGHGDGSARAHTQGGGCDDFDLRRSSPQPKLESGFVNHSASQMQPTVIDVDAEDDNVQIIEKPRQRVWRSASATNTRFRRESTRSESSLFVTPHPGERSTASATVSPSRRTVIDLTIPTRIKRSASPDRPETKKRKIVADA